VKIKSIPTPIGMLPFGGRLHEIYRLDFTIANPDSHKTRPLRQIITPFTLFRLFLNSRTIKTKLILKQMQEFHTPIYQWIHYQWSNLWRGSFLSKLTALLSFTIVIISAQSQTTHINPAAEGGFELAGGFAGNGWTVVNGTNNTWQSSGVGTPFAGTKHAFISNDGGTTYGYNAAFNATNHFYRDVTLPAGQSIITLTFQKKNNGETGWDRILVYTAPTSVTPVSGTPASNGTALTGATVVYTDPASSAPYTSATVNLPASLAGTTFRLIFAWQNDGGTTGTGAAIDNISLTSALPTLYTASSKGGFWSQTATWVGGVVPAPGNDILIPDGASVVIDQVVSVRDLTIGSAVPTSAAVLHSGAAVFALTAARNVLINGGGQLYAHNTTANTGYAITVGGNFTNNGFVNLAAPTSSLTFNGATGSTLSGTGTFMGNGTNGIIRSLNFTSNGASIISTSQNLTVTAGIAHTAGSLNTNGKLTIDNTAAVFGQAVNQQVVEIVMTNVGAGYTSAPTVTIAGPTGPGTTATATANFDLASGTVRSITITNSGSGYRANPVITITGGGFTTTATATAVVISNIAGTSSSLVQRSAEATVTGGVTINSTQGVGGLVVTNGGLGYTSAPTVGFSLPTNINLITACGSGYNSLPSVAAVGGGGTSAIFTTTVANGQITSIYVSSGGAGYTSTPAISITGGGGSGATAAFPVGSIPTATAAISNGMVSGFIVTNAGSGYVSAPAVTLTGGGFTTAASGASSKVGLYNLTLGLFLPALNNPAHTVDAFYPSTRRLNNLTMNSANSPVTLTGGDWTLYGSAPLTLTSGNINMSGNKLIFTFQTYAGIAPAAASYITNGSVRLTSPGGSVTRTFPLSTQFQSVTGTGSLLTGSNITSLTCTTTGAPSGSVSPSGSTTGTKAFRLQTSGACGATAVYGTAPTAGLSYNGQDALISDNPTLLVGQSTALSGPYTVRSITTGFGSLTATGSRTTATTAPGPITITGDDYFAWTSTFVYIPMSYEVTRNTGISYNDISSGGIVITASGANAGTTINVSSTAGLNVGDAISYVSAGTGVFAANTVVASIINGTSFTTNVAPTTAISAGARIFASPIGTRNAISGISSDDGTGTIALTGTSFVHSGSAPTSMTVGNNGYITFNGGSLVNSSWLNTMAGSTRTIAPFWDDLISPSHTLPGAVSPWLFYQFSGGALGSGNAVITIQWKGMETFLNNGPNLNFQVKLFESDNHIEFNYGKMIGFDGTVGLNGAYAFSYSTGLSNNLASTTDPVAGQVLAQQTENTRHFSPFFTSINSKGANYLTTTPECNSQLVFTPGTYTAYTPGTSTPPNDEPANAIQLNPAATPPADLCSAYYSSKGATLTALPNPAACGNPLYDNNDDDVWFKFQSANDSTNIVVASSAGYDAKVEVYADATPGSFSGIPGTLVTCSDATLEGLTENFQVINLIVGHWYYSRVFHRHGGIQATATATVSNGQVTSITVNNAGSGYMNGAYGGTVTASPKVYITGGGGRNAVAQSVTVGANSAPGTIASITVMNGGTGYTTAPQVTVEKPNWGISGDFAIYVYQSSNTIANDNICQALPVVVNQNCNLSEGPSTLTASSSGITTCSGTADDDVWLTFEATTTEALVRIDGAAGFVASMQLFSSSNNTCTGTLTSLACITATTDGGIAEKFLTNLVIGSQYYIRVYNNGTGPGSGSFQYCVSTPCAVAGACGCTNPIACNYLATATYDLGNCEFVSCCNLGVTGVVTNASCPASPDGAIDITVTGGNAPFSYSWNGGANTTVQDRTNLAPGTYAVLVTDAGLCTATATFQVSDNGGTPPGQPSAINGPIEVCRNQTGVIFSTDPIPGATSYLWTLPGGATGSSSTNSITLSFSSTYNTGNLCVSAVNNCGTGATFCRSVVYSGVLPGTPGAISGGSSGACSGNSVTYSIDPVSGASSYQWVAPVNSSVISGQGTTSATIQYNAGFGTTGTVRVRSTNCAGSSAYSNLTVYGAPGAPVAILGITNVCAGATETYSVNPVNGASSYNWVAPAGCNINSGQGTTSISVTFDLTFVSGILSCAASSVCGTSSPRTLTLSSVLGLPGNISGQSTNLCGGGTFTYTIAAVSGATSYNWTVPAGCNIVTDLGTSITIDIPANFVSGSLCYTVSNSCGTGPSKCLALTRNPSTPASISGSSSVCPNATNIQYSTPQVGSLTYTWTVPSSVTIVSGQGTNTIVVNWGPSAGALFVKANNTCGSSANQLKSVSLAACFSALDPGDLNTMDYHPRMVVYPNPSNGTFTIQAPFSGQIYIKNELGQIIRSIKLSENNFTSYDVSGLSAGLYFISGEFNGEYYTEKVIITH
jgi:hypothetical protein